jgi:2-C-methyl-D-erythritol 4-phosphate cytidylyltransferase/2-C-methyl-D-erythritol 2,4-cyclodiphosphate synthase
VAIVLAAGTGERLGSSTPKAFEELEHRSLLRWATAAVASCGRVGNIVVAVPAGYERRAAAECSVERPVTVVPGGASRHESVWLCLAAAPPDASSYVCHDAARPFADAELFDAALDGLNGVDGAVPVLEVPDTVKRVRAGLVVGTEDRSGLFLAQTPQAFRGAALREAHERARSAGREFTDDAAALEWAGYRVAAIPGSWRNFKITTPADLERARSIAREARADRA